MPDEERYQMRFVAVVSDDDAKRGYGLYTDPDSAVQHVLEQRTAHGDLEPVALEVMPVLLMKDYHPDVVVELQNELLRARYATRRKERKSAKKAVGKLLNRLVSE